MYLHGYMTQFDLRKENKKLPAAKSERLMEQLFTVDLDKEVNKGARPDKAYINRLKSVPKCPVRWKILTHYVILDSIIFTINTRCSDVKDKVICGNKLTEDFPKLVLFSLDDDGNDEEFDEN